MGISYRKIGLIDGTKIVAVQRIIDRFFPGGCRDLNCLLAEDGIRQVWLGRKVPVSIVGREQSDT